MGGKGAEYMRAYRARKAGAKSAVATSVVDSYGHTLDLSGSPLVYSRGRVASSITPDQDTAIKNFEGRRFKNKIEFSEYYNDGGDVLASARGGKHSVQTRFMNGANLAATAMSHNHPSSVDKNGMHRIGGTFSKTDLQKLGTDGLKNLRVLRATAAEGTYVFERGDNYNRNGFLSHYDAVRTSAWSGHNGRMKQLNKRYREGGYSSYGAYIADVEKSATRAFVDMHNGLLSGQKQYGYRYGLERR